MFIPCCRSCSVQAVQSLTYSYCINFFLSFMSLDNWTTGQIQTMCSSKFLHVFPIFRNVQAGKFPARRRKIDSSDVQFVSHPLTSRAAYMRFKCLMIPRAMVLRFERWTEISFRSREKWMTNGIVNNG